MVNAYSLFGELKADTTSFQKSLRDAESRLKNTEKAITDQERRAVSLGKTSAVTARAYDRLNESVDKARKQLLESANQFQRGKISSEQMEKAINKASGSVTNLNSKLKDSNARLTDFANKSESLSSRIKSVGSGLTSLGQTLSLAVTAPIVGAVAGLLKLGAGFDAMRNKMTAATGSTELANAKIKELRALAQSSAGVLSDAAVDLYSFFKPMQLGDATINELIKSFGRLKLANEDIDLKQFGRNLTQLFTQGFERTDLKELVGAFPRAGEIFQEAFKLSGSDLDTIASEMKAKLASGLSKEDFFATIADAINKDKNLSKLSDTVGIRFQKMLERIYVAFEPLAQRLLTALEPILPPIVALIEKLGEAFGSLSPYMQTAIVAVAGIVAALAPLMVIVGTVISSVVSLVGSFGTVALVAGVVAGAIIQLSVPLLSLSAGIYALYQAWQTNWGGIRDVTEIVVTAVTDLWNSALKTLSDLTNSVLNEISAFWKENGEQIMLAVREVGNFVKSFWQATLASLSSFWKAHGEEIKAVAFAAWDYIKVIVKGGLQVILGVVQAVAGIINGDWSSAWEGAKRILKGAWDIITQASESAVRIITNIITGFIKFIANLGKEAYNAAWSLGENIGKGLYDGIMNWEQSIKNGVKYLMSLGSTTIGYGGIGADTSYTQLGSDQTGGSAMLDPFARPKGGGGGGSRGGSGGGKGRGGKGGGGGGSKQESPFQRLLNDLNKEIAMSNALTREQKLAVDLLDKEYKGLNATQKETLLSKARQLDLLDKEKTAFETAKTLITDVGNTYKEGFVAPLTEVEKLTNAFNENQEAFNKYAQSIGETFDTLKQKAFMSDAKKAFEQGRPDQMSLEDRLNSMRQSPIPLMGNSVQVLDLSVMANPPKTQWQEFWDLMKEKVNDFQADLPDLKTALSDNLVDMIYQAGDAWNQTFSDAILNGKNFFSALAENFGLMVADMLAQAAKLLFIKSLLSIVGSAFGGGFGGGAGSILSAGGITTTTGAVSIPSVFRGLTPFATGGFTGAGGKYDPAGIVHKNEYVFSQEDIRRAGGLGNVEAFAQGKGGGRSAPTVNVYIQTKDLESFQRSEQQIRNQMMATLRQAELGGMT